MIDWYISRSSVSSEIFAVRTRHFTRARATVRPFSVFLARSEPLVEIPISVIFGQFAELSKKLEDILSHQRFSAGDADFGHSEV